MSYRVSGSSSSSVSVMFNNDFGDERHYYSIDLPWSYTFTIKDRGEFYFGGDYGDYFPASVSARRSTYTGPLTVTIYVNGKAVASASSTETRPTAEVRYKVNF
ncbi:MAG: hypothetical protein FWE57_04550 [Chitinispirillia bacterium]|nr:hypothetical protein [Chitinispirillia bacterium]